MRAPFFKSRPVPLFPAGFAVCVADTVEEAAQIVAKKHLNATVKADEVKRAALCVWSGSEYGVCFARKHLTHGTLAHEMRHVVDQLKTDFGFGGVGIARSNMGESAAADETAAYLAGDLTGWVYRVLKKAGELIA